MPSFADLKKNRKSSIDLVSQKIKKFAKKSYKDERYWNPTIDKAGNSFAIIRFLPAPDGEEEPVVQMFRHAFQGPGGWYFENSLTTVGKDDPVGEYNQKLWATGIKKNQELVSRELKRRLNFHANIVVVDDPANPDNNGKIFLYSFGKRIFDKIEQAIEPPFPDQEPFDPFNPWEGANLKLKIRKLDGQRNYDSSEFESPSPILDGDDDKIEELHSKCYSLKEIVADDQFKSYDELKRRLVKVLQLDSSSISREEQDVDEAFDVMNDVEEAFGDDAKTEDPKPKEEKKPAKKEKVESEAPWDDNDEDFDLSEFDDL